MKDLFNTLNVENLMQYNTIGITGIIGSGKSYLSTLLTEKLNANIIEIDDIRRDLLWYSLSALAVDLRKEIIKQFEIKNYDGNLFFNRETFTQYIFKDINTLNKFNNICFSYFKKEIKIRTLKDRLNCIVWVNLIEDNYIDMVDYVILLNITEEKWIRNNKQDLDILLPRLKKQNTFENKLYLLNRLNKYNINIKFEVLNNE